MVHRNAPRRRPADASCPPRRGNRWPTGRAAERFQSPDPGETMVGSLSRRRDGRDGRRSRGPTTARHAPRTVERRSCTLRDRRGARPLVAVWACPPRAPPRLRATESHDGSISTVPPSTIRRSTPRTRRPVHVDIKKLGTSRRVVAHPKAAPAANSPHRTPGGHRPIGGARLGYAPATAIEDHSRLAYTESCPRTKGKTADAFWQTRARRFTSPAYHRPGPTAKAPLQVPDLADTGTQLGVTVKKTRPTGPDQGKVERFHRTMTDERPTPSLHLESATAACPTGFTLQQSRHQPHSAAHPPRSRTSQTEHLSRGHVDARSELPDRHGRGGRRDVAR